MPFNELSNALFAERQLLELLVFKLDEEQLLLAAGRGRWLVHATREVETVLTQVRHQELDRAVRATAVAQALGLPSDATLRDIALVSPSPWGRVLTGHHEALERLVLEVNAVADTNRELLARGQASVAEAMAGLLAASPDSTMAGSPTYSNAGSIQRSTVGAAGLVNRAL